MLTFGATGRGSAGAASARWVLVDRHCRLAVFRLSGASRLVESFSQIASRLACNHPVARSCREGDRLGAARSDVDRRQLVGQREDSRVADGVVLAVALVVAARPQR